jgi:hypothetical protein
MISAPDEIITTTGGGSDSKESSGIGDRPCAADFPRRGPGRHRQRRVAETLAAWGASAPSTGSTPCQSCAVAPYDTSAGCLLSLVLRESGNR